MGGCEEPRPRIIYLGGLGRSGTTLIERLLGELPGACSVGEVAHLWRRGVAEGERCGCGEGFQECSFWQRVGQAAFGGWDQVDLDRIAALQAAVDRTRHLPKLLAPGMSPAFRRSLEEYVSYYVRLYGAITQVSGCPAVLDSSKHASLAFCLSRSRALDLRVVHVVRDSRAVAYSWTKAVARPDAASESYMTRWSPRTTAGQWNTQNAMVGLLGWGRTPSLRLRYEDVVRAPAAAVRAVAGFAGLPLGSDALKYIGEDGSWADLGLHHTASGNPMRFTSGRIEIRPDERWRAALPARQGAVVTALTLPLLARYGYLRRTAG